MPEAYRHENTLQKCKAEGIQAQAHDEAFTFAMPLKLKWCASWPMGFSHQARPRP